jgi:hypothetical protein
MQRKGCITNSQIKERCWKMICDNCGENFEITHKDIKERIISKEKGMREKYFLCPKCKAHYHIITTDAEMRQAINERAKIRVEIDKLKGKSQSEKKIRELIGQDTKLKYFLLRREKYLDKVSREGEVKP